MEIFIKNSKILLALISLCAFDCSNAEASSSFNSQAALSFSVATLSPDLQINSWFDQGAFEDGMIAGDGAGAVVVNFPSSLPSVTNGNYAFETFVVGGTVTNGHVLNSSHSGWYNLEFTNTRSTAISVSLSLNYDLSAFVAGQYADSDVRLDYYLGNDFPEFKRAYASVFDLSTNAVSGTKSITFDLAPGTSTFHADVTVASSLQAAPVPLPTAVWSFLAGLLGILGLKKRKPTSAEVY